MHQSRFDLTQDLRRRPRENAALPRAGIFTQRGKHRPNPIGISSAEIVEVSECILRVRGLDAIDGTPVLDIKPHVPAFDTKENVRVPE